MASGSSPMHSPRVPRDRSARDESLDASQYALGKAVFNGKARLIDNRSKTKLQRMRLQILAVRAGRAGAHLTALAGRLREVQLDALEYYVSNRFRGP